MAKKVREDIVSYPGGQFDRTKHVFRSIGFREIIDNAVDFLIRSPIYQLPPPVPFMDAGVYAIYYKGDFELYAKLAQTNSADPIPPIYIGKAVPPGWRTARASVSEDFESLYNRLREHTRSIEQAQNLRVDHFNCRFMILENDESSLIGTVEAELIRRYRPLWNSIIDGFGNHDPGSGRYNQRVSEWDTLHPGRSWAKKLKGGSPSIEEITRKVEEAIATL
jgi:hypothetical protein